MMSGGKKRKVDTDGRHFQEKWTEEFFFILHNGKPICLLCNESISVMKEFNIKRHYSTKHATQHSLTGQLRTDKIQKLKANIEKQQQMFHKQRTQLDNVVKASFIVSSKLTKALKPFAEGEFIKECMLEVCGILCPGKKNEFEKISLSRRTVVRRIEMMANDIKTTLTDRMAGFDSFSIALDESTDLSGTAQLTIFIRGIDKEFTVTEELLALQPLKATTTGEDIFNEVQKVFTSFGLPWSKLIGVCTDGAPSMVGLRKGGFIGILNKKASELNVQKDDLIVLHCIIHQQNLCSKSIRLHNVMNVVVKTINFIRSRGLNHRQFKTFLDEISSEYNDVTYYCEVRWMRKGKMLKRFYELRNEIADFMKIKDKPLSELSDPKWICDLALLCTLYIVTFTSLLVVTLIEPRLVAEMYCSLLATKILIGVSSGSNVLAMSSLFII
ncbi:general transcription factor II-I repeat domain-containing protein 2-like [Diorhabda sublineata]|uniref:general transcription factor II-I repeat domain-containing protein 2-like n=1 Tax=Diorhabda sublineata TaxID=1163346 RepID=UPI0024E16E2C|nr:general transcription factor II-I repeat domain-containing protein 2-like [Diorhabda sublineata]